MPPWANGGNSMSQTLISSVACSVNDNILFETHLIHRNYKSGYFVIFLVQIYLTIHQRNQQIFMFIIKN